MRMSWSWGLIVLAVVAACSDSAGDSAAEEAGSTASVDRTVATEPLPNSSSPLEAGLVGDFGGDITLFPEAGNGGYQVEEWRWDLTISDDLTALEGSVVATAVTDQDLQRFSFDARGLDVNSVVVDGRAAEFALVGPELVITLAENIDSGDRFVVEIGYAATPDPYSPAGAPFDMGWDVIAGSQVITQGFPGAQATWVPSNQIRFDPARYVMTITVPAGFTARAAGHLESSIDNGDTTTFMWDTRREIGGPTLAIGAYETHTIETGSVPVEVSLPVDSNGIGLTKIEENLPSIIEFLEGLYGPFPFAQLNISALANRPFAFAGPMHILIQDPPSLETLVHEVAHQWLGGSVGRGSAASGWLFEGGATYTAEVLWPEQREEISAAELVAVIDRRVPETTRPLDQIDSLDDFLDGATYQRGALLFHALRLEIGDENFFATMRAFVDQFAHSTATPEDLEIVAETIADRNLDEFFTAWVSQSAVPPIQSPSSTDALTTAVDADPALVEYFTRVEQLRVPRDEALNAVPEPSDLESLRVAFTRWAELRLQLLDDLSGIDPPDAVAATHENWLELQRAVIALDKRILARLDGIETEVELEEMTNDPEIGPAPQNVAVELTQTACLELRAIATANRIVADLRCVR